MTKKIKNLIGLGLGTLLLGTVAFSFASPKSLFKLRATNTYECYGNVRIVMGENGYEVTHIGGDATTVVIPSEINGVPVTSISADAFDDCRDTLTDVTIDMSVAIGDGALNNMENELNVTFTGDSIEINYGHIFENTTIGTMTIPESVTTVSEETFYGITDTTTLVYEGSFDNFYNSIFHSLWDAFNTTINSGDYTSASMPSNIVVGGTTYFIPDSSSAYFGATNGVYHCYYFKQGTTPSTFRITKNCSFGINGSNYYKNNNKL